MYRTIAINKWRRLATCNLLFRFNLKNEKLNGIVKNKGGEEETVKTIEKKQVDEYDGKEEEKGRILEKRRKKKKSTIKRQGGAGF